MPIIRWKLFNFSSIFEDDWDFPTLPGLTRLAGQGLNLYETESELVAEAALPGIAEDSIDVTIDDGIVRITGAYKDAQQDSQDRRYYMSSMIRSFNYSFRIPQGMLEDKEPVAELNNGVLVLRFKKTEKVPPKKVRITSKKP